MSLKGNLQSVDLANVLQMLSINQKEGALVLFDGDNRKSIYFSRDGVSMLSRGRRGQDSLGRILLRYGRITEEALKEALGKQKAENKRLGEVLLEMGTVSPTDIDDAIRTQIEEEIYNLFIWKEASFEFVEGPPPPELENVQTRVTFNVNSLIMEAQRRADEWNYIRGLVPSLDEIYRPTEKMGDAVVSDEVFHFPFAPRILEKLQEGRLNVSELIEVSHAAKFEACKIVANLLEQGAIEPVTISDLQAFAQEASGRGDHAQSAKFLSRVVDLGGATPGVNMSLGYSLEAMDEPERASIYFKAAAESYVEAMEPKNAFDAYQRIARALPTDLPAVLQMVEIAFNTPELLAANRHEVTEAGRILAQCLKELGRLPASIQVLNGIVQSSPQDMPLRNMLVQAYQDSGMANEAMTELESMADFCASQKNLDEAIRCLRRVIAIDRNRPGILKKIESLTRNRDSGKRVILRFVAVGAMLVAAGVGWWGFRYYSQSKFNKEKEVSEVVSAQLDPLFREFEEASKRFTEIAARLEFWKTSTAEAVHEEMKELEKAKKRMEEAKTETGRRALTLHGEHKSHLPPTFVEDRTSRMNRKLEEAGSRLGTIRSNIAEEVRNSFHEVRQKALTYPFQATKELEKILSLLKTVDSTTVVVVENRREDIVDVLKSLQKNLREFETTQGDADALWKDGKLRESHEALGKFLGNLFTVREFCEKLVFRARVTVVPAQARIRVTKGVEPDASPLEAPRDLKYTVAEGLSFQVSAPGFRTLDVVVPPVKGNFDAASLMNLVPYEKRVVLTKVPVWTAPLGKAGLDAAPVPTPDGRAVVAADRNGGIHLISLEDGSRVQTYDSQSPSGFLSSPLVTADSVFAATVDGVIIALDFPSLKERWRKAAADGPGESYGGPFLVEGLLVVASRTGNVMAFDPATGAPKWSRKLDAGTRLPLLAARGWIVATCEDGRVRVLSMDGKDVIDVLPSSREEPGYPPPRSRTLAVGDRVLIGLEGAGQEFSLVELPVPGASSPHVGYRWGAGVPKAEVSGACMGGEDVFLLFSDGTAWRISPRTGKRQGDLKARAAPEKEAPVGYPAFKDGTLYISTVAGLAAVKPGMAEFVESWKWTAEEGTRISTAPLLVGKLVLVGARDGNLYALLQD